MDIPVWFDAAYYLQEKALQVGMSVARVKKAFDAAGFIGIDGIYRHYDMYSTVEGTSPSPLLDHDFYMRAKAAQCGITVEALGVILEIEGMTAGEHYDLYGWQEGLSPSEDFNGETYLAVKAAREHSDVNTMKAAFAAAGLSPLEHYLLYAAQEGITQDTWESWLYVEPETPWDVSVDYSFTESTRTDTSHTTTSEETEEQVIVTGQTDTVTETVSVETTHVTVVGSQSVVDLDMAFDMIAALTGGWAG